MVRFITAVLVFVSLAAEAQQPISYLTVDSKTYEYYLKGDWDNLIKTGEEAIEQKVDYKRLRQRMGYAYFVRGDFYNSQIHYEKALTFDEYDTDTHTYLYYCGLNTGNQAYARFHAARLPKDLQQKLKEEAIKPVDVIDVEFNYKANNSNSRSNPTYFRAGITTQLGFRISLYQSVSAYQQTISTSVTKQPGYFALLNWSVTSKTSLDVAYHYLNTKTDGIKYPDNLVYAAFSTKINRFNLGLSGSFLNNGTDYFNQVSMCGGIILPGKSNIYLNSTLSGMMQTGFNRIIFSQTARTRIAKTLWAEGNVTMGNLQNYNDHNALYIYNSIDPSLFRTGLTLFFYPVKKMIFFGNYMYETKNIELTNSNYKQQSFSGGIIWKL
jgi:hypothetical protein